MVQTALDVSLPAALREWLPSPAGAREMGRLYAQALNEQVARKCCELLEETDLAERTSELARAAAESGWTTPALAFANYVTLADDAAPNRDAAARSLAELEHVTATELPPTEMARIGKPDWVEYVLKAFVETQRRNREPIAIVSRQPDAQTLAAVARAGDWLEAAWPEMAAVVRSLVREVRWFELGNGRPASATFTQTFGAMFLTPAPATRLYEFLVHEATHMELTTRMALDPLVSNRADRAASPLRTMPRPLSRVLHATFVAGRLVYGLRRCLPHLTGDERAVTEQRAEEFVDHVRKGLATLDERAEWTEAGAEMIERMRSDVASSETP
jgi:hypothetical protein